MKKKLLAALCLAASLALPAGAQTTSWTADNGNGTFTNPLFYDEFSDPDIIRVGDDYYLAGTTMHTVPGLVILHSRDLVNWENVSYCFDRFDFEDDAFWLRNHKEIYGQGIWAPAIRYANGQFYVFSNVNGKGLQCYTSTDIRGPWKHHNMEGRIYDLSVLFDDDGKIYAIHGYGEVHCTELKPDMSGPKEETDRVIIPEGNAVGEGHHMYKINGMYYLISTDYKPNGRTLCSRSKSIWGPYETITITADETFGYHAASLTQVKGRIVPDGTQFALGPLDKDATACTNIHQGGIVQTQKGDWYALLMMDFHSIGRTVTLAPITWKDGWPMLGLEGNLGRAPRTWFKPDIPGTDDIKPHAPYQRSEDFNGKTLGRVWQWNHKPVDSQWSLSERPGWMRIYAGEPVEGISWARNTLTQRTVGPKSSAVVKLDASRLKPGDRAGICAFQSAKLCVGVEAGEDGLRLVAREDSRRVSDRCVFSAPLECAEVFLRLDYCFTPTADGDPEADTVRASYSCDGVSWIPAGDFALKMRFSLDYFTGYRTALYCYTSSEDGGYADFDFFHQETIL